MLLNRKLDTFAKDHVRHTWKGIDGTVGEAIILLYNQHWLSYNKASRLIPRMFNYWKRYWGDFFMDTRAIRSLLLLRWKESVLENIKDQLESSLLKMIEELRNDTKPPPPPATFQIVSNDLWIGAWPKESAVDRASLIRSVLDSFIVPTRLDNVRGSDILFDYFKGSLFRVTSKYHMAEARELRKNESLCSVGYTHWILHRLSMERAFLPDFQHKGIIVEPMLKAFHQAHFTPEIEAYYRSPQRDNRADEGPVFVTAGQKPYDDMVRLLTRDKRDLNKGDRLGRTALHTAVLTRNTTLIKTLLRLGALTDVGDKDHQTAGHLAVLTINLEALNILMSRPEGFPILDTHSRTVGELMQHMNRQELSHDWAKALDLVLSSEQNARLFIQPLKDEVIEQEFQHTLVRYKSGLYSSPEGNHKLDALLVNDAVYEEQIYHENDSLTWLHLPVNNVSMHRSSICVILTIARQMRWIEVCSFFSYHKGVLLNNSL